MELLEKRIASDGKYLGNGILKVDSFMNHQIDPALMKAIGEEFAGIFQSARPTRILTAESSGIAPSLSTAMILNVPVVFARKHQPITMAENPYKESAQSHTHGNKAELTVSSEYLTKEDRVLVIDDFLATARTIHALLKIVESSGAELVGVGAVIEKVFEGGRQSLSHLKVPVESLAAIERFDGDKIVFAKSSKVAT